MSPDLLVTKLYIPPARKNTVSRPRLTHILNDAWQQDKRLTLVSAPAGYGKTTLVTEWLRGLQTTTTWLSLEEADNDPARFLAYLIAALGQVDGRIGENTQAMLQSPQPLPPEVVLTALINEIAIVTTSFILVLDDYHVIESLPIHQQLDFLVEHQPPQMHLVIITREDPPLPLARLRARGQMVEIRQDDLRFSLQECADFLQRCMGINLSLEDIAALERRTEGWIAGLQLASIAMQSHLLTQVRHGGGEYTGGEYTVSGFIKAFSGSSRYVLEYLLEEVIERLPAEEQDFLLKTSILDRLSGALCDAVANRTDSRLILKRLEHANLFIIPLDQARSWYRYHHLFAELLRQRLHYSEAFLENELHRLACDWFATEGFLPEAINHALSALDWEKAAELISENSVMMLRRGELMTLLGWLKSLPDKAICQRPQLCKDYGWALSLTGQLDAADAYLRQAEAAVQDDNALLGEILVAQAYNLRAGGDNPQAIERAQRAMAILPQTDTLSLGLVALTLGLAYWNYGDFQKSEQAFIQVDQAAQQSRNHYARMTALTYLGMIQAVYGRLRRAAELCRRVIELGGQSPTVAPAHIELGALLHEWNDLEAAARHAQVGIEQSQRTGNPLIQCDGYRTLAIIQQSRGEPDAARSTLHKTDQLADSLQVAPLTRIRNAACHVRIALAQSDLAAARSWAELVTRPTDTSLLYPCLGLTPVRISLACHEKTEAADRLKELYETARENGCGAGMVEVRALQALAADAPGDALRFLQDALKIAQPEGFIRTFVDKGEPMKVLLERLRLQGGELKGYIRTVLAAFGQTSRASPSQLLVEPLSERELEVLRLVAEGKSNREIAERLIVSVGTIKTHVHNSLEKLGVRSRTQAVAQARELKLL